MKVLITGAAGFVGQELALALLADPKYSLVVLTDIVEPSLPAAASAHASRARCVKADLSSPAAIAELFTPDLGVIYLLHGIMSGASEANLELGYKVNIDTQRAILDHVRATHPGVKIVFPSTVAVYGPPSKPGEVFSEATTPVPQSSYGAAKLITETLLNDLSRRGQVDGRIVRLPTIIVRPGKPTGAASSFASGIIREPLAGEESILPVARATKMWISSPKTLIRNLIIAQDVPKEKFGLWRTVCLPGVVVSVDEMLDTLEKVGGKERRALVKEEYDAATDKLVQSWPYEFDTSRAYSLGFVPDVSLEETVRDYAAKYGKL